MIIKENGRLYIALHETTTLGDIEAFKNGIFGLIRSIPSDQFDEFLGKRICEIMVLLEQIGLDYDQAEQLQKGDIENAFTWN